MTIGQAVDELARRFGVAGIDTARLDARVLVAFVLDVGTEKVFGYPEIELEDDQYKRLLDVARRRENREPLARITGQKEFWSLPFSVSTDTLIPRPDSECLVEAVLDQLGDHAGEYRILDLGTGTGCLLISLLHELPRASGIGVDISQGAIKTAVANAERLDVGDRTEYIVNDWCAERSEDWAGYFDIIVSNPPYIPDDEIATLEPEVRVHEPLRALAGGRDGLDIYRLLIGQTRPLTKPGGIIGVEVGAGQAGVVAALGQEAGLELRDIRPDLAGVERCVLFKIVE